MNKKNLLLGGILGILLILAFVYNGPFEEWKSELGKPSNFLAGLEVSDISKIEIIGGDKEINIDKIGEAWKIEGTKDFYLETVIADTVITTIEDAIESDLVLVSENNEKKSEFETNEKIGYKIKLKNGEKVLAEFVVGKSGTEINSSYLAQSDSDNTYLVKADLRTAFVRDDWYNKSILSLDKEKISKIRFQYPSREFTIEKTNGEDDETAVWAGILPYKFSINQEKIDTILDLVSSLKAVSIPAQTFDGTGLEKNTIIVQLSGEDIDAVIMIGDDNGEEQYYAKRGDSDNIYLIAKSERDELEKRISNLR
jgi:hypothetical protein